MEPKPADSRSDAIRRKRILLVEDDFLTRWSAAEYLRETGFEILEAVNAREAMEILTAATTIDAVFCNIDSTPRTDGLAFAQWLAERYRELPVLFTSADSSHANSVSEGPLRRFVGKPYTLSNIEHALDSLLDGR